MSAPPKSEVYQERLKQGRAAVFSVSQAARLLGFEDAARWLRRNGLVSRIGTREKVVWGAVIDCLGKARPVEVNNAPRAVPARANRASNRDTQDPWDVSAAEYLDQVAAQRD